MDGHQTYLKMPLMPALDHAVSNDNVLYQQNFNGLNTTGNIIPQTPNDIYTSIMNNSGTVTKGSSGNLVGSSSNNSSKDLTSGSTSSSTQLMVPTATALQRAQQQQQQQHNIHLQQQQQPNLVNVVGPTPYNLYSTSAATALQSHLLNNMSNQHLQQHMLHRNNLHGRNSIDMQDNVLENINKVLQAKNSELENDYVQIQNMSLLTNEASMTNLYKYSTHMKNKIYLINIVVNMYEQLYPEFFEKYNFLRSFVICTVNFIVNQSYDEFKKICSNTNTVVTPQLQGMAFKLNKWVNKSKKKDVDLETSPPKKKSKLNDTSETSIDISIEEKIDKEIISTHPFLNLLKSSDLRKVKEIFELKHVFKYCVPSFFATLVTKVYMKNVIKYQSGQSSNSNVKASFRGLCFDFKKMVLAGIMKRLTPEKQHVYYNLFDFSILQDVWKIAQPQLTITDYSFVYGNRLQNSRIYINDKDSTQMRLDGIMFDKYSVFTFLNKSEVIELSNNTIEAKSFSTDVYCIEDNYLILDENLKNAEPDPQLLNNLENFFDSIFNSYPELSDDTITDVNNDSFQSINHDLNVLKETEKHKDIECIEENISTKEEEEENQDRITRKNQNKEHKM